MTKPDRPLERTYSCPIDLRRAWDENARDFIGHEVTFAGEHRPLDAYTEALARTGLLVERLRERAVPPRAATEPHTHRSQRVPLFLHIRALKPRDTARPR